MTTPAVVGIDLGTTFSLAAYVEGGRPVVVCMTSLTCPVARKYLPVLAELEKQYAGRGVTFIVANPNAHQSPEEMRSRRRAAGTTGSGPGGGSTGGP